MQNNDLNLCLTCLYSFTIDFIFLNKISLIRWDDSEDGKIDVKELTNWISAMVNLLLYGSKSFLESLFQYFRAGVTEQKGEWDPKKRAKEIIAKLDITGDKKLNKHEFVNG